MAHSEESESIFYDTHNSSLGYDHNDNHNELEHDELEHDEMMDIPHSSKSILDQVDDFLNDHQNESEDKLHKPGIPSSHSQTAWVPSAMQVDLDHLSHSLFTQQNGSNHGRHDDDHDMDMNLDMDLDREKNLSHDQSHSLPGSSTIKPNHIRPDLIVSPMVSPMIMPSGSATDNNTPFLGCSNHNNSGGNRDTQNDGVYPYTTVRSQWKSKGHNIASQFSPLSSPALTAIDNAQRINYALPESTMNSTTTRKKSIRTTKKKSSGNLASASSSTSSSSTKVVKNSPRINAKSNNTKRHSKASPVANSNNSNNSWDDLIFKLPESSIEVDHSVANTAHDGVTPKSSSSGMLSSSPESRMTPATLMNYPKVILPSNSVTALRHDHSASPHDMGMLTTTTSNHSDHNNNNNDNHNNNNSNSIKILRATESPVIKPKPPAPLLRKASKTKLDDQASSSVPASTMSMPIAENIQKPLRSKRKASMSSSLNGGSGGGGGGSSDEGDVLKKEVHKAAEQGRRNRLNTALSDLNSLIPPELKESVTIPSKATTVEMACTYIRQLLEAINSPASNS